MIEIVIKNINERVGNICKLYAWVEIYETTPVEIKLLVLESCFFNSIIYGIEAWGSIDCVKQNLRLVERKALKRILKVKSSTSDELVYHELRRANIISKIKDRQFKCYQSVRNTETENAIVKSFMELYKETDTM